MAPDIDRKMTAELRYRDSGATAAIHSEFTGTDQKAELGDPDAIDPEAFEFEFRADVVVTGTEGRLLIDNPAGPHVGERPHRHRPRWQHRPPRACRAGGHLHLPAPGLPGPAWKTAAPTCTRRRSRSRRWSSSTRCTEPRASRSGWASSRGPRRAPGGWHRPIVGESHRPQGLQPVGVEHLQGHRRSHPASRMTAAHRPRPSPPRRNTAPIPGGPPQVVGELRRSVVELDGAHQPTGDGGEVGEVAGAVMHMPEVHRQAAVHPARGPPPPRRW